jgi:hypothetical protein
MATLGHIALAAIAGLIVWALGSTIPAAAFAGFLLPYGRETTQRAWKLIWSTGRKSLKELSVKEWISTFNPFTYDQHNRNDVISVAIFCGLVAFLGSV